MSFSEKEQQQINTLVRRFEADTGVEAVASVIRKADVYPEIPWKAFAIGSAIGALGVVIFKFLGPELNLGSAGAHGAMTVIGLGAVLAAATAFIPGVARLFLDPVRAHAEARQFALALFLERELFGTSDRCAILVLVCRFERVAVVIVDKGLAEYAPSVELERIAVSLREPLRSQGPVTAFEAAFEALRALFSARRLARRKASPNEIESTLVGENGV